MEPARRTFAFSFSRHAPDRSEIGPCLCGFTISQLMTRGSTTVRDVTDWFVGAVALLIQFQLAIRTR